MRVHTDNEDKQEELEEKSSEIRKISVDSGFRSSPENVTTDSDSDSVVGDALEPKEESETDDVILNFKNLNIKTGQLPNDDLEIGTRGKGESSKSLSHTRAPYERSKHFSGGGCISSKTQNVVPNIQNFNGASHYNNFAPNLPPTPDFEQLISRNQECRNISPSQNQNVYHQVPNLGAGTQNIYLVPSETQQVCARAPNGIPNQNTYNLAQREQNIIPNNGYNIRSNISAHTYNTGQPEPSGTQNGYLAAVEPNKNPNNRYNIFPTPPNVSQFHNTETKGTQNGFLGPTAPNRCSNNVYNILPTTSKVSPVHETFNIEPSGTENRYLGAVEPNRSPNNGYNIPSTSSNVSPVHDTYNIEPSGTQNGYLGAVEPNRSPNNGYNIPSTSSNVSPVRDTYNIEPSGTQNGYLGAVPKRNTNNGYNIPPPNFRSCLNIPTESLGQNEQYASNPDLLEGIYMQNMSPLSDATSNNSLSSSTSVLSATEGSNSNLNIVGTEFVRNIESDSNVNQNLNQLINIVVQDLFPEANIGFTNQNILPSESELTRDGLAVIDEALHALTSSQRAELDQNGSEESWALLDELDTHRENRQSFSTDSENHSPLTNTSAYSPAPSTDSSWTYSPMDRINLDSEQCLPATLPEETPKIKMQNIANKRPELKRQLWDEYSMKTANEFVETNSKTGLNVIQHILKTEKDSCVLIHIYVAITNLIKYVCPKDVKKVFEKAPKVVDLGKKKGIRLLDDYLEQISTENDARLVQNINITS